MATMARMMLQMHLEVEVGEVHLAQVIAPALNSGLPNTALAPYVLLLSPTVMGPFIGDTLHGELQR